MECVRQRLGAWALALMVLGSAGAMSQVRADDPMPADGPGGDVSAAQAKKDQAKYERDTEYLFSEYGKLEESSDWLTRSLTAISLARLPQGEANRALLKILKEDRSPATQLVAWECLLARSATVDPEQFATWMKLTPPLVEKGVFNGRLRVDLLRMLAIDAPDEAAKNIFMRIFAETNSLQVADIPVIEELGHTLAEWKSPDLVKWLIEQMQQLNSAYRAELVLKVAGCPVAWAGNRCDEDVVTMWRKGLADYVAWWKKDEDNWKEKTGKVDGTPWRNLSASFLTLTLFDRDAIKANNPEITKDFELGSPSLRAFDVMFVVDATDSMRPPMDWLKDDLRKMMLVMSMMSSQPRIGITFYRDYYKWPSKAGPGPYGFVAKTYPLTTDVGGLMRVLAETKAMGGGDDPEAVSEGLAAAYHNGGWDLSKGMVDLTPTPAEKAAATRAKTAGGDPAIDPKVMVLIGDAPPHPGTEKDCVATVKAAAAQGFKVYAVKLTTPLGEDKGNLPAFDQIAAAGNGVSFAANFTTAAFEFRGKAPARATNVRYVQTARNTDESGPSKELVTRILADAVNQKYRERIALLMPILLEMCDRPVPEARELFKAAPAAPPKQKAPKQNPAPPKKYQQP